jgi:hypothetical protein
VVWGRQVKRIRIGGWGFALQNAEPVSGRMEVADKVVFRWWKPMKARHLDRSLGGVVCFLD